MSDALTNLTGRVLFVDDDDAIRHMVTRILTAVNIPHDVARSALEAMGMFEAGKYSVAVIDVVMPGIDGLRLGRLLRKRQPDLPLLYFTAIPQDVPLDERTGVVAKGSDTKRLLQQIARMCG